MINEEWIKISCSNLVYICNIEFLNTPLQTIMDCSIDDVIRSRNKSKLWTAIAMSKYELEKRSKAHNVGNWTGYQKFKFQIHIQISKFWQVRNLRLPFHLIVWSDSLGWKGPEYFLKSYLCTQNTCYFFLILHLFLWIIYMLNPIQ